MRYLRTVNWEEIVKGAHAVRDSLVCGLAVAVDVLAAITHLSSVWFHKCWLYDG